MQTLPQAAEGNPNTSLCSHSHPHFSVTQTAPVRHSPSNSNALQHKQKALSPCSARPRCLPAAPLHTQPAEVEAVVFPLFQVTGVKHSIGTQVVLRVAEDLGHNPPIPSQQGLPVGLGRAIQLPRANWLLTLVSSACDATHDAVPRPSTETRAGPAAASPARLRAGGYSPTSAPCSG